MTLNGIKPKILMCPVSYINHGLNQPPEILSEKLIKYKDLLIKQLEEDQYDSGSWVALAMQLINDGYSDKAKLCFERACMSGGTAYMPFKEMGLLLLREAKAYLMKSHSRIHKAHPYYKTSVDMLKALNQMAPEAKIIKTSQDLSEGLELPNFDYNRIGIDEFGEFIILPE